MKVFVIFSVLICFSSFTFAAKQVELNSKVVNLGYLGNVEEPESFLANSSFELVRTFKTPKKVRVVFSANVPEEQCKAYQNQIFYYGYAVSPWVWGGYYGGYRSQFGYGYGYGYYGMRYGYGYYGYMPMYNTCTQSVCQEYIKVSVVKNLDLKIKFKRKTRTLHNGQTQGVNVQFFATENAKIDYQVQSNELGIARQNKNRLVLVDK